ncbi:NAD-dependent epimerase/dehydratase family protein [Salinarimonas ramus]|uniref:Epimerase n=1 Tax=Salinarimonas ramus TaxID=690164 RepID=A0A917QAJ5_9HYPH|nr:NAD-dependent epimerase/dehydratase family protein [Salinarimonas ramus]GGK40490.1 epimerase [Salinarimonas ramus]
MLDTHRAEPASSGSEGAILLTGAAGFTGQAWLAGSAHAGRRIVAVDREPIEAPAPNVVPIRADIRDRRWLDAVPDGVSIVVHGAAALPSHDPREIVETDVDATRTLLAWAAEKGVSQVVHLSSTAVYGPAHAPLVTEDRDPVPYDAYNTAKIRAEALLPEVLDGTGTAWTILRPKAIVGPGRLGLFGHLFDFAAGGHGFPIIGDGRATYQFLHVDDLVTAIDLAIARPQAAHGATLNVASRAEHDIATLFQSVLDRAGHGKTLLKVPKWLAKPVLLGAYRLGLSPVYHRLIANLCEGSTVSLERAHAVLGYVPAHTGMSALADGFDWYRAARSEGAFAYGKGHRTLWRNPLATLVKAVI